MPAELQFQSDPEKFLFLKLAPPTGPTGSSAAIRENYRTLSHSLTCAAIGLALLASLCAGTGMKAFGADEQNDVATSLPLDRVIVTATRTSEDESRIGSAFSQLTGQELETEQIIDLKNAFNTTPGAFALEGGARGGFTTRQPSW